MERDESNELEMIEFTAPIKDYVINSEWGKRTYYYNGNKVSDFHYGVDLTGTNRGLESIYCAADGIIVAKGKDAAGGLYCVIKHEDYKNTYITRYWHFSEVAPLQIGAMIKSGEYLGMEGKTGNTTGNHLHFEIWVCPLGYKYYYEDRTKYAVNPLMYI